MTIEEIERQIQKAREAPLMPDGTSEWWDLLPRVPYSELPEDLKKEADRVTPETAKKFLLEMYPVGSLEEYTKDKKAFNNKILEALHTAKYFVQSTDTTPPEKTGIAAVDQAAEEIRGSVSLIGSDFAEAWEKVTSGNADRIISALPQLKAILPTKHTMPNNKLANELPKDLVNAGGFDLIVGRKGHEDLTSYVMATLSDQDSGNITMTGRPYTEYDRSVMDAIVSLWLYGDQSHAFTPDMIYRTMNHKTEAEYVSPQQKAAVTRSIEKMRRIHVTIDATEEVKKSRVKDADGNPVTSFKYDDALLSAMRGEMEAGGKTVEAYSLNAEPILLRYSRMTGQLLTINAKYLDVKEVDKAGKLTPVSLSNNEQRIPVRDYLLRRISVMKNDRKNERSHQSNRILFETLFADTGANISKRQYAANTRKYAFQVLDFLKASSFIAGYTVVKDGRSIKGVDIIL